MLALGAARTDPSVVYKGPALEWVRDIRPRNTHHSLASRFPRAGTCLLFCIAIHSRPHLSPLLYHKAQPAFARISVLCCIAIHSRRSHLPHLRYRYAQPQWSANPKQRLHNRVCRTSFRSGARGHKHTMAGSYRLGVSTKRYRPFAAPSHDN